MNKIQSYLKSRLSGHMTKEQEAYIIRLYTRYYFDHIQGERDEARQDALTTLLLEIAERQYGASLSLSIAIEILLVRLDEEVIGEPAPSE